MEEEIEQKREMGDKDPKKDPLIKRFFNLSKRSYVIFIVGGLLLSFLASCFKHITIAAGTISGYSIGSLLTSLFSSLFLVVSLMILSFFLPETSKAGRLDKKRWAWLIILSFFGVLAGVVLQFILIDYMCMTFYIGTPLTLIIVSIYQLFTYSLTVQNKLECQDRLWEIYRFALVGAIAAVFDFSVTYLIRYGFETTSISSYISTFVAVGVGFTVGVIINYICSVTMVFKTHSDKDISRKASGILLFVGLATVGLFIGIGLEVLFFNVLKLPAIVSFIIRTLVVLVWNYISRKVFIFK